MPKPSRKTNNAVEVTGLTVAYGTKPVLEDVSFSIPKGSLTAVIGPNGSGKTTLIRTILGLVRPASGTVSIFGKPLASARNIIGYVPQKFNFDPTFPITVGEFLRLGVRDSSGDAIRKTLHEVGLVPHILTHLLGSLSGGQLQRVLIAQAIINEPELLILDEPATGIDVVGEAAFYDVIEHLNEDHGTTVVLISHDVSMVAQKVDQVICVNRKLLCSGPPKKTLTKSTLEALFKDKSVYEHAHPEGHHHHEHE